MKYRCKRECFFSGKLYNVGEIANFEGVQVPEHFVPLEQPKPLKSSRPKAKPQDVA